VEEKWVPAQADELVQEQVAAQVGWADEV